MLILATFFDIDLVCDKKNILYKKTNYLNLLFIVFFDNMWGMRFELQTLWLLVQSYVS